MGGNCTRHHDDTPGKTYTHCTGTTSHPFQASRPRRIRHTSLHHTAPKNRTKRAFNNGSRNCQCLKPRSISDDFCDHLLCDVTNGIEYLETDQTPNTEQIRSGRAREPNQTLLNKHAEAAFLFWLFTVLIAAPISG